LNSTPLVAVKCEPAPIPRNPAPEPSLRRLLYSPKETEALLGISHATCYRLINAGKLDARKIGGKTAITAESIERFLAGLPRAECAA
jgi:excisionase family DNA binding protein